MSKSKNTALTRRQLGITLKKFNVLRDTSRPLKGWIRAIRDALGMSGRQLAQRVGLSKQRAAQIEKQEAQGAITIGTLQQIAGGLGCKFVYGFVPERPLDEIVRKQATKVAMRRLATAKHTMMLESQSLDDGENREILEDLIETIIRDMPKDLWNES